MEDKAQSQRAHPTDNQRPCDAEPGTTVGQDPTLLIAALTAGVLFGAVAATVFLQLAQSRR